jgi:hypothetical protein
LPAVLLLLGLVPGQVVRLLLLWPVLLLWQLLHGLCDGRVGLGWCVKQAAATRWAVAHAREVVVLRILLQVVWLAGLQAVHAIANRVTHHTFSKT